MNKKLMVAALLSLVACNVENAAGNEEALKRLLGKHYGYRAQTTPVKTKKVTNELSPTSRRFISENQKAFQDLENTKERLKQTSESLLAEMEKVKSANEKNERLSLELENKTQSLAKSEEQIEELRSLQNDLIREYNELAATTIRLEATTALKMKITEKINDVKLRFGQTLPQVPLYINQRYLVEFVALRLVASVDSDAKRQEVGLKDVYDEILRNMDQEVAINEFTLDAKYDPVFQDLFKTLYETEKAKVAPVPVEQNEEDHVSDDDLIGHL